MLTDSVVWLIAMIVLILLECISLGLTTIWFAGGALIAWIAAVLHAPLWLQIILFLVVSIVMLVFTRPIAVKYFNKDRIKTNASALIGQRAIVTEQINNLLGTGKATIGGQEWTARANIEEQVIEKGTVVNIVQISGVKLIVEERKEG